MMDKEARKYKKALKELTASVIRFERALDMEMQKPSSPERGSRIAKLVNALTVANQSAMHFALGYSFKKINKLEGY